MISRIWEPLAPEVFPRNFTALVGGEIKRGTCSETPARNTLSLSFFEDEEVGGEAYLYDSQNRLCELRRLHPRFPAIRALVHTEKQGMYRLKRSWGLIK